MSRVGLAVYKVVLFAYPSEFRRAYGDAMVQSVADRHRHGGVRIMPWIVSEVVDVARAAPRMRWESPMNRIVILITGATVAAAVALAVSPSALIPIAGAVCAAGLWCLRQGQPIRPATSGLRRGLVWLVAVAAGIAAAVAIPSVDVGGKPISAVGTTHSEALGQPNVGAVTTHRWSGCHLVGPPERLCEQR